MTSRARSCLDLIECRFDLLTSQPRPLVIDGGPLGCGLPDRPIPLDELRIMLLKRQTAWLTKDAAWQELVRRAHAQPEPWVTAATGMMLPGLKHIGGKLGTRYPGEKGDLDSEVLQGFLQALDLADPRQGKLHSPLYSAAFRRGHEAYNRENRLARDQTGLTESCRTASIRPRAGHPDLVLAGAMLDGAVTPRQADLISRIHLDRTHRGDAASPLGLSRHAVGQELASARRRLLEHLEAA